jgi:TraX protein
MMKNGASVAQANATGVSPRGESVASSGAVVPGAALDRRGSGRRLIAVEAQRRARRPWVMADGSPEAIKWVALVLMVLDHVNKYFYAENLPVIFQCGRIVMPMFGFVLAYNLARPDALARGVHHRMMYRLTLAGLAASPMYIILNGMYVTANAWWPLNILFMLLLVVALTYLIDRGGAMCYALAVTLFLFGGAVVEYLWMGVLSCLGAWLFCRDASTSRLLLWFLGTLSLTVVNGNAWALVAIPMVFMAGRIALRIPRLTWVFYAFYPAHLLLLLGVRLEWF